MESAMRDIFQWLFGDKVQLAVAGALGGVVRWLTLREHPLDGVISVIVGAICASYLSPLALPLMDPVLKGLIVDEQARLGFSGFIIGIGGIGVAGFVMDVWRARRADMARKANAEAKNDQPGDKPQA
jgi:hypothetical protein